MDKLRVHNALFRSSIQYNQERKCYFKYSPKGNTYKLKLNEIGSPLSTFLIVYLAKLHLVEPRI